MILNELYQQIILRNFHFKQTKWNSLKNNKLSEKLSVKSNHIG